MPAYYNEFDKSKAKWLRELIKVGAIAPGEVDERDIRLVRPDDLLGFSQCHFFAGIGGWSYALRLAGWDDEDPVWTGSCPCQPFSEAGDQRGFADDRHLWPEFFRLICASRPPVCFGEQVARGLGSQWIDLVWTELEAAAFTFWPVRLCAPGASFNHARNRWYWVAEDANAHSVRWQRLRPFADGALGSQRPEFAGLVPPQLQLTPPSGPYGLQDDGVSGALALLRGYGDAIVPPVAAEFIRAYRGSMP